MVVLLGILKLVAAALTAFFAAYGLLHDFRRDGKVTREGKIALCGGVVSAVVTMGGEVLGTLKQRSDDEAARQKSEEQIAQSNALMTQVLRGVYPLKGSTIDLSFGFTPIEQDTGITAAYRKRLDREIAALEKTRHFGKTESGVIDRASGQAVGVVLKDGSPLLPRHVPSEEIPWIALNKFTYVFQFYTNMPNEQGIGTKNPNLSFSVTPIRREFGAGLSDMLQIETYDATVITYYHDDGTIDGLKDLSNVLCIVWLSVSNPSDDVNKITLGDNLLLRSSELRMLTFHVGPKNCSISGSRLAKRSGPAPGWWFRFGDDTLKNCSLL
jgi:hypothetical protein